MRNHRHLRADGVSVPAEAELWGKGRKGVKGKFQGLYAEQKDENSMETPPCIQDKKSVVMH